jgi:hypothetical protein
MVGGGRLVRCAVTPSILRGPRAITSIGRASSHGIISHSAAAEIWLRTAPSPHAFTAATNLPRIVSPLWPTA